MSPRNDQLLTSRLAVLLLTTALLGNATRSYSHGGVVLEEDLCVINIGFLKAHFTVYQIAESANKEFCEDLPIATSSQFVIEYLHEFMRKMPVDFRVIQDTKNLGMFANWDDVQALADFDKDTIYYQAASTESDGVLELEVPFSDPGRYIGIVTASHPTQDKVYRAVFPFQVGASSWGYLPLLLALFVVLQIVFVVLYYRRSRVKMPA